MIALDSLRYSYPGDAFSLELEQLQIGRGETVALIGPSGCGKTTLLNLISGNLLPDVGTVTVAETRVDELSLSERQKFRLETIGLVPQSFELLDYLTIAENIGLPFQLGKRLEPDETKMEDLGERLGIFSHWHKYPGQLSQGERQRVVMCRALATSPRLILADEPTGNLDPENQDRLVALLLEVAGEIGATVLMITHEPAILPRFSRTINLLELRGVSAS